MPVQGVVGHDIDRCIMYTLSVDLCSQPASLILRDYVSSFILFYYQIDEGAFSEQSVKQVLQSAKENLKWSLLKT